MERLKRLLRNRKSIIILNFLREKLTISLKFAFRDLCYKLLYTKQSLKVFRIHSHRDRPNVVFYYNPFGRFLFMLAQIFALVCRRRGQIWLEHFEEIDYGKLYSEGNPDMIWPLSVFVDKEKTVLDISNSLLRRLESSYQSAYDNSTLALPQSKWWSDMTNEFRTSYFEKGRIRKEVLQNFRCIHTSKAAIVADQLDRIFPERAFSYSFLKSLSLVMDYHRMSNAVDHAILSSVSESFVGNNKCPVYRGQRLSGRLLTHAYYLSQIKKHVHFTANQGFTILELGGAYGGLARLLALYYVHCKIILVELPEVCVLAGYFLSASLPHKKVCLLADMDLDTLRRGTFDWSEYDIFVLPTWLIDFVPDDFIDVAINTTSLAEMSREYGNYYLNNIERVTRDYFYSNNRPRSDVKKYDDYGFYKWDFKKRWRTVVYTFSPTGHAEWLGQKVR